MMVPVAMWISSYLHTRCWHHYPIARVKVPEDWDISRYHPSLGVLSRRFEQSSKNRGYKTTQDLHYWLIVVHELNGLLLLQKKNICCDRDQSKSGKMPATISPFRSQYLNCLHLWIRPSFIIIPCFLSELPLGIGGPLNFVDEDLLL